MSRHILVKDGVIIGALEVDPANITTYSIRNDQGARFAGGVENGELIISTTKYLAPEGTQLIETNLGNPGDAWPLVG